MCEPIISWKIIESLKCKIVVFFNIVMDSVSVANSQRLVWYCVRWYMVNTRRLH